MRLKQLHYFFALALYGNFKTAYNAMGISHSVLSQQMQELENSLKTQLFILNRQEVELTAAGKELYAQLPALFKMFDDLNSTIYRFDSRERFDSLLQIGYDIAFDSSDIANYITIFKEANPTTHCIFRNFKIQEILDELDKERIDIAFLYLPHAKIPDDITVIPIKNEPYVLCMVNQIYNELQDKSIAKLVAEHNIVCTNNPTSIQTSMNLCVALSTIPNLTTVTTEAQLYLSMLSGSAIAILPKSIAKAKAQTEQLKYINIPGKGNNTICTAIAYKTHPGYLKNILAIENFAHSLKQAAFCKSCIYKDSCKGSK